MEEMNSLSMSSPPSIVGVELLVHIPIEEREGTIHLLSVIDDPSVHRENIDHEVEEKKAVIENSAMMDEAAKRVDKGDRDGALSIIKKALGSLKASPAAIAPAVQEEMERARQYSDRIEGLDDMAPAEVKEMQKDQKYRSYQELHQQ